MTCAVHAAAAEEQAKRVRLRLKYEQAPGDQSLQQQTHHKKIKGLKQLRPEEQAGVKDREVLDNIDDVGIIRNGEKCRHDCTHTLNQGRNTWKPVVEIARPLSSHCALAPEPLDIGNTCEGYD